jgi:hypothetical protein
MERHLMNHLTRLVSRATAHRLAVGALSVTVATASLLALGTPASAIDKFKVQKTAVVATIEGGDTASFQIVATAITVNLNNIVDNFTLTDQLPAGSWSVSGPNAGACSINGSNLLTCLFGSVPEGQTRTIIVSRVTTTADCNTTITNTARVTSDDLVYETEPGDVADNVSTATITVHCAPPPPPGGNIVPTGTTCQQFRDGTAADLNEILYGLKNGTINNVAPGIGFYFVRWTSTGAAISIVQTDNGSTPAFGVSSVQVYTASDCARVDRSLTISTGTTTTIGGTTSGIEYIVRLAFDPNTVKGSANPGTVTYTYTTLGVANSTDTIALALKP